MDDLSLSFGVFSMPSFLPCFFVVFCEQVSDDQFMHRANRFPRDPPATKEVKGTNKAS